MTDSPEDPENQASKNRVDDAWADALAEQAQTEAPHAEPDAGATLEEDDIGGAWAEAMAEQQASEGDDGPVPPASQASSARSADDAVFKPLSGEPGETARCDLDTIMEIPVTLSVELGSTRLSIRELLNLAKGSIVELDGLAGEPMDILINRYLVAQGEVVVVEDKYGIRITDIINRAERVQKLNR